VLSAWTEGSVMSAPLLLISWHHRWQAGGAQERELHTRRFQVDELLEVIQEQEEQLARQCILQAIDDRLSPS
jgi:hypothetical protein